MVIMNESENGAHQNCFLGDQVLRQGYRISITTPTGNKVGFDVRVVLFGKGRLQRIAGRGDEEA